MLEGKQVLQIGLPEEQRDFIARHRVFFDRLPDLTTAMNLAFIRTIEGPEPTDRVIFYLGRACVEDFFEILLLCGNGYGFGAMRLLRSLYERAVSARYMHLHPDAAEDYLEYYWITKHKESQALLKMYGEGVLKTVPREKRAEIETQYARVRERLLKKGIKRPNVTWSKLDFVSMAREVGPLGELILPAYYLPLEQAHSTSAGIVSRLGGTEEKLTFVDGPQRDEADSCLHLAHNILLQVLALQQEHFAFDVLAEPLTKCYQDFLEIWGERPSHKPNE